MLNHNIILDTDSYKFPMWEQYPPKTETIFSYLEARGGYSDYVVFFGLQYWIKEYLLKPITQKDIDDAANFLQQHGEPFNKEGWEYILHKHGGYLPVKICAIPEGTPVKVHNALLTIENTDPNCFWLPSHLETSLLRACWYGTSVATTSHRIKQIIKEAFEETSDSDQSVQNSVDFRLHDFGARGVSSYESSAIGGAAHLVNFKGTDTIAGIRLLNQYYNPFYFPGYSIPASEHSTMTSWGKEHEVDAYRNMLDKYKSRGVFACVSDSYDIYNAVEHLWGEELRQEIIDSGCIVVIRPDSGKPSEVVLECLKLLAEKFGYEINDKGYKVLKNVKIIQGDGICEESIKEILSTIKSENFSAENVFFGMGGKLLQGVNRDTHEWAIKCSAAKIDGEWRDVFKSPIHSGLKKSKKGRLSLLTNGLNEYITVSEDTLFLDYKLALKRVYENGFLFNELNLEQIRENSSFTFAKL